MTVGATSIRSTSPMRSAHHEPDTYVSDARQTNKRMSVNRYEPIVQHSNGESARAKSSHRPDRSLRSTYATDDRWNDSRRPHSHSVAPGPLVLRLVAASLA